MDSIRIQGGRALRGTVRVDGSKNAALPILSATLLGESPSQITHVPRLRDIRTCIRLLSHLGLRIEEKNGDLTADASKIHTCDAPYQLVKEMRASVLVLGPLLSRFKRAKVSMPGGCAIGARPIDQHLKGLTAMGANIQLRKGYVEAEVAGQLHGAEITFDMVTVTGTENLLCAAALAKGTTVLRNAAREPEVIDLARALQSMGADIEGVGSDTLVVRGKTSLSGAKHAVMPDRIVAGTYMIAVAATGGDVFVEGARMEDMKAVSDKLIAAGVGLMPESHGVRVVGKSRFTSVDVVTEPYPGFPTDMQAQFITLMCLADGRSVIEETIFENRFMHVAELNRMGADIKTKGRLAIVRGVPDLQGTEVMATDLRASASLIIAGLCGQGTTEVRRVYHLDRGYEAIETKLALLGAHIERVRGDL